MKWIDIPPVWLVLHLLGVWGLARFDPLGFGAIWALPAGTFLLIAGLSLMLMAVWEMRQHNTTPIPHMNASHLVTSGIFAVSRNPIYLGDVLVLAGVVLRANSPLSLVALPLFIWVIRTRFIAAEEMRLERDFGSAFVDYCTQTRRWI